MSTFSESVFVGDTDMTILSNSNATNMVAAPNLSLALVELNNKVRTRASALAARLGMELAIKVTVSLRNSDPTGASNQTGVFLVASVTVSPTHE